jgi:hypothetical protein
VWREGNYVRLFDAGVQGKMWRQIQAMGEGLKSKVRLPFGETEFFRVRRGVPRVCRRVPLAVQQFHQWADSGIERKGAWDNGCGEAAPFADVCG